MFKTNIEDGDHEVFAGVRCCYVKASWRGYDVCDPNVSHILDHT